ncbi:MAG: YchF/TatD family DNA exonuclease [Nitrospiraceae bacterium]|nr:YchF/TatD family DNA exonuclease [Nitrospiraceae bacterium]
MIEKPLASRPLPVDVAPSADTPRLVDTHCHLEDARFDADRDEVIKRAQASCPGVGHMITVGTDIASSEAALRIAHAYPFIYAAVGVHPHEAKGFDENVFKRLLALAEDEKTVAIGETGLDYHYMHSPREAQVHAFRMQVEIARQTGLPVIVHSREADDETLEILGQSGRVKGVLHCFSGDAEMAGAAMAMGFYISIAGPVTFRKAEAIRRVAAEVPDDYLLIETDAPYLAPGPLRGQRNEPAYLAETAKAIAAIRGISPEDLARITSLNASRLFGIGEVPGAGRFTYRIRDSLYLNLTNRCTNSCSFCVRFYSDFVKGHKLRLTREPDAGELISEIGEPGAYKEIVFCGYGEPLMRLDVVKEVAAWVKAGGGKVRINTNGHGSLINGRNILPELKGLVDGLSISLDAQDEKTYAGLCKPVFPGAFAALLDFIRESVKYVPEVRVTVVRTDGVDVEACRSLALSLGVKDFRVRELDAVG